MRNKMKLDLILPLMVVSLLANSAYGQSSKEFSAQFDNVTIGKGAVCGENAPFLVTEHYNVSYKNVSLDDFIYLRWSEKFNSLTSGKFDQKTSGKVTYTYCAVPNYSDNLVVSFSSVKDAISSKPMRFNVSTPNK